MAAYGFLVSLMNTINDIQDHPRPPISLDESEIEPLTEMINFFKQFLRTYNPHASYSEEADPLEDRIARAANSAEYAIDLSIKNHTCEVAQLARHRDRQRVIHEMGSIKKEALEITETEGVQHPQIFQLQTKSSTSSGSSSIQHNSTMVDIEQANNELLDTINFFKQFIRTYYPHASYSDHTCEVARLALHRDLQRVIHEMGSIKKEALEITQIEGVQHPQTKSSTSSGSSSIQHNSTMVGIEQVTNELLDKLTGGNRCRQVIPVTGMGGIGKTTLATNVYQHQTVVKHFDICAWATISQDFRMKETLLKLLKDNLSEMNEGELGVKLRQMLIGRRYLIVLDDIWDIEVWNKLRFYFPNNNNGSRIVLTTRQSKLAHEVCGYEYPSLGVEMRFLDEDTSWGLFCKVVFEREDFPPELEEMESIGRKIVASCKGLPLSINVIGGLLATSPQTWEYWEYVVENLNSIVNSEDNEHCLKILYTSYNSLPVYLKPCFMYMGVFEEDNEIHVYQLIRLLVAEGFVEAESGKSLEEVAEEWLTELVDRNLILIENRGHWRKSEFCKVHDLLRDLCLREARKHNLIHIQHASTNLVVDRAKMCSNGPLFRKRLRRVYSISLLNQHDPDFVYQRINIRLLEAKLPYPNDSFLSSISSCWNLQTIVVKLDFASSGLPIFQGVWKMSQLRHVEFWASLVLPDPLDDDSVLKNLQTLSRVKNMKFGDEEIKRLPNIKKLKVYYEGDEYDYCLKNVCQLHKLSYLSLECASLALVVRNWKYLATETQTLTFPHSLKELRLSGTKLPWKDMTKKLGSLPQLSDLRLSDHACIGGEWHTAEGQFCNLKILEIEGCDLEYWETESSHFPRLEHLLLTELMELKEVPSSIGDIPTLKSIILRLCRGSAKYSAIKIREEQENVGNDGLVVLY